MIGLIMILGILILGIFLIVISETTQATRAITFKMIFNKKYRDDVHKIDMILDNLVSDDDGQDLRTIARIVSKYWYTKSDQDTIEKLAFKYL